MADESKLNTDRELWREPDEGFGMGAYMPSIHVAEGGGIGINVGGMVHVMPLRRWHDLAEWFGSLRGALRPFAAEAPRWVDMGGTCPINTDTDLTVADLNLAFEVFTKSRAADPSLSSIKEVGR